jgi:hypothetical protein
MALQEKECPGTRGRQQPCSVVRLRSRREFPPNRAYRLLERLTPRAG